MQNKIRIGTRASKLALWQAEHIYSLLKKRYPEQIFEIVKIKTTGDQDTSRSVQALGTKNVFVKELEDALSKQQIDLAVHSLKDLSSESPKDLSVGAFLGGVSRQDVLITNDKKSWKELPPGSRVATGSLRRILQWKKLRPDLECVSVRGNVDTRLRKLEEGQFEALILASAGLERLGLTQKIAHVFSVSEMVPAGGQGILAVELRKEESLKKMLSTINDPEVEWNARTEFAFIREMGAGCDTPLGVLSEKKNNGECLAYFFLANVSGEHSIFLQKQTKIFSSLELADWVRMEWKQKFGFDWHP
jgi:hydroxymethylbilane synthase